MELKEFISETIKQIAEGTEEGKKHLTEQNIGIGVGSPLQGMPVKFDVAVTSDSTNSSEVGGKITVVSIFFGRWKKRNTRGKFKCKPYSVYIILTINTITQIGTPLCQK